MVVERGRCERGKRGDGDCRTRVDRHLFEDVRWCQQGESGGYDRRACESALRCPGELGSDGVQGGLESASNDRCSEGSRRVSFEKWSVDGNDQGVSIGNEARKEERE